MKSKKNIKHSIPIEGIASSIELRIYKLSNNVNVQNYTLDDIRFMLTQQIVDKISIDRAIEYLEKNVLIEASYYEGDLLVSLVDLPPEFWAKNQVYYQKLKDLITKNKDFIANSLDLAINADRNLIKRVSTFMQI